LLLLHVVASGLGGILPFQNNTEVRSYPPPKKGLKVLDKSVFFL